MEGADENAGHGILLISCFSFDFDPGSERRVAGMETSWSGGVNSAGTNPTCTRRTNHDNSSRLPTAMALVFLITPPEPSPQPTTRAWGVDYVHVVFLCL